MSVSLAVLTVPALAIGVPALGLGLIVALQLFGGATSLAVTRRIIGPLRLRRDRTR